ncbi:ATP/GTP-binding protein, partial [Mycobacterium simiae]
MQTRRRLRAGELRSLANLLDVTGLSHCFAGDAVLHGSDPVIRSPHRLGEAAATALLLMGAAGAAIWQNRSGVRTDIATDIVHALHYLHPTHFVKQAGYRQNVGAEYVPTNGVFQTRDNRYVMLEAGPPYPKLLSGYLNFFDCGNNKQSLAREVAKWEAEQLEDALSDAGLPVCRAFTREEWLAHPQGKALAATTPVEIVKIADGSPVPFSAHGLWPLSGIRVLDFTHVLAGPRSTRTLGEYGAEVLR